MTNLTIGKKAPKFSISLDANTQKSLSDYRGKKLVLYFYPKDDTPGCTTQAINFSAVKEELAARGVEILGVSADSIEKHEKFRAKHNLTIDLGSDPEMKMLNDYGVWVEKNMYGRKYMGIERSTFLIDETGTILQIWQKVKVKTHLDDILTELGN